MSAWAERVAILREEMLTESRDALIAVRCGYPSLAAIAARAAVTFARDLVDAEAHLALEAVYPHLPTDVQWEDGQVRLPFGIRVF